MRQNTTIHITKIYHMRMFVRSFITWLQNSLSKTTKWFSFLHWHDNNWWWTVQWTLKMVLAKPYIFIFIEKLLKPVSILWIEDLYSRSYVCVPVCPFIQNDIFEWMFRCTLGSIARCTLRIEIYIRVKRAFLLMFIAYNLN